MYLTYLKVFNYKQLHNFKQDISVYTYFYNNTIKYWKQHFNVTFQFTILNKNTTLDYAKISFMHVFESYLPLYLIVIIIISIAVLMCIAAALLAVFIARRLYSGYLS